MRKTKNALMMTKAEIALSVMARPCLHRRLGDHATMEREVAAWAAARDVTATTIDGQFTTADARMKLKRLYPAIDP
jgi:hypothetical protein